MNDLPRTPKRILIITYFVVLHLVAIYFLIDRTMAEYVYRPAEETRVESGPAAPGKNPASSPVPSVLPEANVTVPPTGPTQNVQTPNPGGLIIPVAGVRPDQLTDSFADARSDTRVHDAIDIMAPAGTPVLAATDGEIVRFFDSEQGGITIYQLSADRKFIYYYAHLQRRADDIKVGDKVTQGKTIAFVGDTGNAGAGNYHLHFSIAAVTDPKRFWEGTYINPYPLIRGPGK
jgi:peptidoglycan LD-endopeptidase LytH